jgi:hypothetical protein
MKGIPSAYDVVKHWRDYTLATQEALTNFDIPYSSYGVMGTPGFASGAFLMSPYSTTGEADIQLTVFPSVSRT